MGERSQGLLYLDLEKSNRERGRPVAVTRITFLVRGSWVSYWVRHVSSCTKKQNFIVFPQTREHFTWTSAMFSTSKKDGDITVAFTVPDFGKQ